MDESLVKHLEQPAKTLKLSEAMRIGARMRPQCFDEFFSDEGSCALGAAWEGAGLLALRGEPGQAITAVMDAFGFPRCSSLGLRIAERNDAGETREEIADWLEERGY